MATSNVSHHFGFLKFTGTNNAGITIATNAWSSVPDQTRADFPYRAAIPATGTRSHMFSQVVFRVEEAMSGDFAPISETGTDVVYIFAASIPTAAITIPTVIVHY